MTSGRSDALEDGTGPARERVGRDRVAEWEPILRIEPVLVLGGGAPRHAEAVVANTLPAPATWLHHTVEDAPPVPAVVHAELEEMRRKRPLCDTPKASA